MREAAPELISGVVGGFFGNYYETGEIGFSPKWAAISVAATFGAMRIPIKGRTTLGGKDNWASKGLSGVPDKMLNHAGIRWLHPRNGTTEPLWDRVQAFRQESRNWQTDAIDVAKNYKERFSPYERRLLSDVIEKEGDWLQAPKHVQEGAKTLAENADAIGRQLVDLGMLDSKAFSKLEGRYLHRYYAPKLDQAAKSLFKRTQRETISGSYSRRRGQTKTVNQPTGKREPKVGETLTEMFQPNSSRKRFARKSEIGGLESKGYVRVRDWQVDNLTGDKMVLWRDYTRPEREAMGEIRDGAFRYGKGLIEAGHDLALGRMFKEFSEMPEYASKTPVDGWWQVPTTKVPGTQVSRYGKLGGMYVHPDVRKALEVVRHPSMNSQIVGNEAAQDLFASYTKALGAWKIAKTAYNPATHFNNIMSNVTLGAMDGEIGPMDVYRAVKLLAKSRGNRADQAIVREAKKAGLSLDVEANLGDEIKAFGDEIGGMGNNTQAGWAKLAQLFVRNSITRAYGAEDQAFKLAYYAKMRAKGMSEQESVKATHRLFFDYGDVPLGVDVMRKAPLPAIGSPFFTYTYKAAPAMFRLMAEKPHRVLAAFGIINGINVASYGYQYGGEDAGAREDYERETMPSYQRGRTSIGTRRSVRMPFNNRDQETGEERPAMLDTYYFIPAGNLFDLTSSNDELTGGWWPQAISGTVVGGNPLVQMMYGMTTNKDAFFGKEIAKYPNTSIFDPNDPSWQKWENTKDVLGFLAYQTLPPTLSAVPDKLGEGAVGSGAIDKDGGLATFMEWTGQDYLGRQLSLTQAAAHALGVKINDFSPTEQEQFKQFKWSSEVKDAESALYKALRNNRIHPKTEEKKRQALRDAMKMYDQRMKKLMDLKQAAPAKSRQADE